MKKIIALTLLAFLFAGCATTGTGNRRPTRMGGNTARNIAIQKLAFMLNDTLRRPALKNKEIAILSFANLNNLEEVEPLGRHLQERFSHALFNLGFRIIEIRLGKDIRFGPLVGELNLSRLKSKLKRSEFPEIQSLVMGTYLDAGDYVHVNAKFIELSNSTVRASGEIKIKKGEYLYKLLNLKNDPKYSPLRTEVYERFPIKPLREDK